MIEDYLHKGCHALVEGVNPAYGYQPSLAAGIVFCVLFGTSMVAHTAQSFWSRKWWCLLFAIGCLSMSQGETFDRGHTLTYRSGGFRMGSTDVVSRVPVSNGRLLDANINANYRYVLYSIHRL